MIRDCIKLDRIVAKLSPAVSYVAVSIGLSMAGFAQTPAPGAISAPPFISIQNADQLLRTRTQIEGPALEQTLSRSQVGSSLDSVGGSQSTTSLATCTATTAQPPEITALAAGLKCDPDLIFEYVYNNIEYEPLFGSNKGALGTLLDQRGSDIDQVNLFAALLSAAGFASNQINFQYGYIRATGSTAPGWLSTSNNAQGIGNIISAGGIPVGAFVQNSDGTLAYIDVAHVWAQVQIAGTSYVFDPSFKQHDRSSPAVSNIASAMGYSQSQFLQDIGGSVSSSSFSGLNRAAARTDLVNYAANLANFIKTNGPSLSVADLLGGSKIHPVAGLPLRQTSLPYLSPAQPAGFPQNWGSSVPNGYRACFTISMPGVPSATCSNPGASAIQLYADSVYGHRITVFSVASGSNFVPTLLIDGALPPNGTNTGTAQASGSWTINVSIIHPYASIPAANQSGVLSISVGGSYLIANSWGQVGRGMVLKHRGLLAQARASGAASTAEASLGEALAVIGYSWIAENSSAQRLLGLVNKTSTQFGHLIGIVGETAIQGQTSTQAPYVDLPLFWLQIADPSSTGLSARFLSTFTTEAGFSSSFEAAVLEQTQGLIPGMTAASTIRLIDQNIASGGITYFVDGTTNGFNAYFSSIRPNLTSSYASTDLSTIDSAVSTTGTSSGSPTGKQVLLPGNGMQNVGTWKGVGYSIFTQTSNSISIAQKISGGLSGGFAGINVSPTALGLGSLNLTDPPAYTLLTPPGALAGQFRPGNPQSLEPVDTVTGAYLYSNIDLSLGSGSPPYSLPFGRSYSSASNLVDVGVGNGWRINQFLTALRTSDPYAGLGEGAPINIAPTVAALYVIQDLLLQPRTVQNVTIAWVVSRWMTDQLTNNAVLVTQPSTSEEFVAPARPDGVASVAYTPSIGSATLLTGSSPDQYGNPTAFSFVTKDKMQVAFSAVNATNTGNVASVTMPNGASLNFSYGYSYNGTSYLTRIANNLGRSLSLAWSGPHLASVSDGTGRAVAYGYDTSGNLATFTDPLGAITRFSYDGASRLTQIAYPANAGNAFVTNSYDAIGRVNGQANAAGNKTTFYLAGTRSETVDPASDRHVTYQTSGGRVLSDVAVLNSSFGTVFNDTPQQSGLAVTKNAYDGQDRLVLTTSPEGVRTANTYSPDFLQNLVGRTITPKSGSPLSAVTTTYAYDPTYNKPTSVTDPLGLTMTMAYDPATGNLVQQVRDAGASPHLNATTGFSYDAHGLLLSATDPLGVVTRFAYDATGNLVSTTRDPGRLNVIEQRSYDAVGNVLSVTDPNGNTTTSSYDAARRPTSVTLPAASGSPQLVTTTTYDPDGNPLQVQQSASGAVLRTTSRSYTKSDKLASATDANGNVTRYAYDTVDRLSSVTDPLGRITAYGYDALSRQITVSNPAIQAVPLLTTQFSPDGLVASLTDANGNALVYAYDGLDRLSTTTYPATASVGATAQTLTYDNDNNVKTRQTRRGDTIAYGYDTLNRLTSKTEPSGTPSVTYGYDLAGHLLSVNDNGPAIASVAASPNFAVTASYDARNRPISLNWYPVAAQSTPAAASVAFTHRYDASNRRISQAANDNTWLSYPAAAGSTAYTPNALNQYAQIGTVTATYDANGSLTFDGTFTYTYDAESRLTAVTQGGTAIASYAYDGRGRRKTRTAGGVTTAYVTGAEDQELLEYGAGSGAPRATYAVNLGGGLDEVLSRAAVGGTRQTLVPDIQGSIIASLDSGGALTKIGYQAFGESASAVASGAGPRYTGRRLDPETAAGAAQPSGLYYYRARIYSPTLGRFLQADPIGPAGGINLYAYVGNDPINLTDPFGLAADGGAPFAPDAINNLGGAMTSLIAGGASGSLLRTIGGLIGQQFLPDVTSGPEVQFAQQGISSTFRNGEFAGQSISDVAAGLRNGTISSDQLPLNVINRDGITYTLNNRSLMTLRQGGQQPTIFNDVTGNQFFESQLTQRLNEIGSNAGPNFVPIIRGQ